MKDNVAIALACKYVTNKNQTHYKEVLLLILLPRQHSLNLVLFFGC